MPTLATVTELLDLTRKSGVADEARLTAFLERGQADGSLPIYPTKLAEALVREAILTQFQAEQLLQGKWRRFTIGKYKVLERIGSGGMGSVFLCEHKVMRRQVAVKVLPTSASKDPSALQRFYREARAVAALDHPNIVRAHDIDQDGDLHFMVMEYVDGASLHEVVTRGGVLSPLRAAHYIRQAAYGLQHAHEAAGIVHRDIKPGNILVDRSGTVKILDMGLARFFQDESDAISEKHDDNILGTADYLAPEQALDSRDVDIRADIYSLGATFYFCLSGKTPFPDGAVAQKLIWHQTRQPKPITTYRKDVPAGLLAILNKMMAKEPDQRYTEPREVADALSKWTATPIPPPPDLEMPHLSPAARKTVESATSRSTSKPASSAAHTRIPWKPPPQPQAAQPGATSPPKPKPAAAPASPPPVTKKMPPAGPSSAESPPVDRAPSSSAPRTPLYQPKPEPASNVDMESVPLEQAHSPTDPALSTSDTDRTPRPQRPPAKLRRPLPPREEPAIHRRDMVMGLGLGIGAVAAGAAGLFWWLRGRR